MGTNKASGAEDVMAKITKFSDKYRPAVEKLHELIMQTAPTAQPRLWYGMPGYAKTADGPVVLFFREDKYMSFGLTENADIKFDDSGMIESAWFLTKLDDSNQKKILEVINRALN